MGKLELIEYIPGEHVHTFLFTDDVKITMSDIKPTKWGDRRAKVEAWCGDTHACACSVTLGDPDTGGKFVYYASQRVSGVDWYDALRLATGRIEPDVGNHPTRPGTTTSRWAEVVTMSDIEEEPIAWLWPPYIAIGKVCILDGDLGTGKSLLAVKLASTLSIGGQLPDQ
jgi:hypothetical protein